MVDALSSGGSECMLVGFNSPHSHQQVKGWNRCNTNDSSPFALPENTHLVTEMVTKVLQPISPALSEMLGANQSGDIPGDYEHRDWHAPNFIKLRW